MSGSKTIVLGVTGSIAAYKSVVLLRQLMQRGWSVAPVMTQSAARFVAPLTFSSLAGRATVTDLWTQAETGQIGHVELAHEARAVLIAPATADTIARLALGRADDALAAIVLATRAPVLLAPAMEDGMWHAAVTQAHLDTLAARGVTMISPNPGLLASGREGMGRMAEPEVICDYLERRLTSPSLSGRRILVTAGPTREKLDPVRFLSNPSTGKMGFALARQAWLRGAEVDLVSGPTSLLFPTGIHGHRIETTEELLRACLDRIDRCDALLMAAAPSDFRAARPLGSKLKKADNGHAIDVLANPDILLTLKEHLANKVVVGFAAESDRLLEHASDKLQRKGLDLIVANDITEEGAGFAHDTNRVVLIGASDEPEALPLMTKEEVASRVLDRLETLLEHRLPHAHH